MDDPDPQMPLYRRRDDANEHIHGLSAKRRKLLPPESSPSRVEDTVQDTVLIKPKPVPTSSYPASSSRDKEITGAASARLAVGESPFASTKEMLEQMHWSDIAILKRPIETSVAFGTQVKVLTGREDRVAKVDELVTNAIRVLEFVKRMGTGLYFGKDLNHMLVDIEKVVEVATGVFEEYDHGDEERKEQVKEIMWLVSTLDSHHTCMCTVLTKYDCHVVI